MTAMIWMADDLVLVVGELELPQAALTSATPAAMVTSVVHDDLDLRT
jgi:hypothetical protein